MKTFLYPYVLNKSDETHIPKVNQGLQARNVINIPLLFKILKVRHIDAIQEHSAYISDSDYASGMGEGCKLT